MSITASQRGVLGPARSKLRSSRSRSAAHACMSIADIVRATGERWHSCCGFSTTSISVRRTHVRRRTTKDLEAIVARSEKHRARIGDGPVVEGSPHRLARDITRPLLLMSRNSAPTSSGARESIGARDLAPGYRITSIPRSLVRQH